MAHKAIKTTNNTTSSTSNTEKYHALIIDSGAIIKQSTFTHLHHSASNFYTVPAVLNEVRDAKSRAHLEEFQMRLASLSTASERRVKLETRVPSKQSVLTVSEFAKKTGDYPQLSGVDLQILALVYELEVEGANFYENTLDHVRKEPKRVLGVSVKALSGDGKRQLKSKVREDSAASESNVGANHSPGVKSFFNNNRIIDAGDVDFEYDNDESKCGESVVTSAVTADNEKSSWAKLIHPTTASLAPLLNCPLVASQDKLAERLEELSDIVIKNPMHVDEEVEGQFDDASESSNSSDAEAESGDEVKAIEMAEADSDVEMSDEECDIFILEPHEAAYYKKLREQKIVLEQKQGEDLATQFGEKLATVDEDLRLGSEFPPLAATAEVPYGGSDDQYEDADNNDSSNWELEEEKRKKKSLQPMVNGRVQTSILKYSSFRQYGHVLSAKGSGSTLKRAKKGAKDELSDEDANPVNGIIKVDEKMKINSNEEYKYKFTSRAASVLDVSSKMTADDDDGEGWVTCTRDIQTIKASGSLHLSKSSTYSNNTSNKLLKNPAPPISQRVACATTDFAIQNVLLQMNLELLTIDGVRVRRLKTWVTRCAACFTIYGGYDDKKSKSGGRLFCDKCGSNTLQRIAASVDRNSGRLKLHLKKNYQHNTRGTKYSMPKAGKVSLY